jgi:hypothetical protein
MKKANALHESSIGLYVYIYFDLVLVCHQMGEPSVVHMCALRSRTYATAFLSAWCTLFIDGIGEPSAVHIIACALRSRTYATAFYPGRAILKWHLLLHVTARGQVNSLHYLCRGQVSALHGLSTVIDTSTIMTLCTWCT